MSKVKIMLNSANNKCTYYCMYHIVENIGYSFLHQKYGNHQPVHSANLLLHTMNCSYILVHSNQIIDMDYVICTYIMIRQVQLHTFESARVNSGLEDEYNTSHYWIWKNRPFTHFYYFEKRQFEKFTKL